MTVDPKSWKPVDGAPCLRCITGALARKQELGTTEGGASTVLSDRLVCPECGWVHTLKNTPRIPVALVPLLRRSSR